MRITALKRNEWEYLYVDQVQEVACYKGEDIEDESINQEERKKKEQIIQLVVAVLMYNERGIRLMELYWIQPLVHDEKSHANQLLHTKMNQSKLVDHMHS